MVSRMLVCGIMESAIDRVVLAALRLSVDLSMRDDCDSLTRPVVPLPRAADGQSMANRSIAQVMERDHTGCGQRVRETKGGRRVRCSKG